MEGHVQIPLEVFAVTAFLVSLVSIGICGLVTSGEERKGNFKGAELKCRYI